MIRFSLDLCPEERPGFGSACRLPEMTCDYGRQTCCGESSAEYQMECRAGEWNGFYIDTVCMDGMLFRAALYNSITQDF